MRTVSFRFLEELYHQALYAARAESTSVTAVIESYLEDWVRRMQDRHNDGQPWEVDTENLPRGIQRAQKRRGDGEGE